jgi:hypothetical protein
MDDFLNKVKIGTSGFSFDDWKDTVYPSHLKRKDWLKYYEEVLGFTPSSMRKCNTWRNGPIGGTLGVYGKTIHAHQS